MSVKVGQRRPGRPARGAETDPRRRGQARQRRSGIGSPQRHRAQGPRHAGGGSTSAPHRPPPRTRSLSRSSPRVAAKRDGGDCRSPSASARPARSGQRRAGPPRSKVAGPACCFPQGLRLRGQAELDVCRSTATPISVRPASLPSTTAMPSACPTGIPTTPRCRHFGYCRLPGYPLFLSVVAFLPTAAGPLSARTS